ncbi:protein DEHYDRATION-INDUCED 19 homolog 5 isoform X2 [Euphorbia lathyris]|uniref:protein DEHYDRATION-INDUCED 19 homolog 5 isoform X2 n=1 Tax=Euphorbia lathyris TaxID=212925 RepID=UPI0033136488
MAEDSWGFGHSSYSRTYHSAIRSFSDLCLDYEDVDDYDDDDIKVEYPCPFCSEDLDLVELCSHIEYDHPFEAKSGICPVCGTRSGMDLVQHITTQHGYMFKRLQKLKLQKDDPYSSLSFLKKELEDDYLQSVLEAPSPGVSSSKMAPDPLLSFLYNAAPADKSESSQSDCSSVITIKEESFEENIVIRSITPK